MHSFSEVALVLRSAETKRPDVSMDRIVINLHGEVETKLTIECGYRCPGLWDFIGSGVNCYRKWGLCW